MEKTVSVRIDDFTGGITSDPRDTRRGVAQIATNYDIFTDFRRMIPYYDSEDGATAQSTQQTQAFCIALRTGTTYSLYGLGVVSGTARAEILYKDLTTGGSNDLDDNTWSTPSNNSSSAGTTSFNLFVYYKKTGYIYGARAGTQIWRFDPAGGAWVDSHQALTYTNIAQGLVHSQDDILYIPYDNKIASNDNGTWNNTALTIPSEFYITSICEFGEYLAIAAAPLNSVGRSRVYLWDRRSALTTVTANIDWGEGVLYVLEELQGNLIGISLAGDSTRTKKHIFFKRFQGASGAVKFHELTSTTATLFIRKQKINNRILFMMSTTLNGAVREGIWSVGIGRNGFAIAHERTPNNDTALGNGIMKGFYQIGDYLFQAFTNNAGTHVLTKTNDAESYTATSIYESVIFNGGNSSTKKKLRGITVEFAPLPAAGTVVLKYKMDSESSYTQIFSDGTNDAISHSSINIESTGATLPEFKEISFRIESTGGAVVTGLSMTYDVTDKRPYAE